ncbi:hypothetical protein HUA74_22155 [Myxococcus sp. CA051A]|nr:hypothetical protein [Myxococcus sp. CA040A]NTX10576.1 hypothetical protein [Myxococcus sp. CA056]NTX38211.1 hypothetical protein [Myxococcus sp. CA033]NTX63360.1 hypothetical protein [Myxococcus sp. CA051A]
MVLEWRADLVRSEDAERALAYWSSLWFDKIADATRKFDPGINVQCSFCEKYQREVRKLIAGPNVFICDECVGLCNDVINEERSST